MKRCTKCGTTKPLDDFHRQPTGPQGHHSWCKECANGAQRGVRKRLDTPESRRRRLLKQRYGLTPEAVEQMMADQGGACGLCERPLEGNRPCVDHDHNTGAVRSILCHRCNLLIAGMDDHEWLRKALSYLGWGCP